MKFITKLAISAGCLILTAGFLISTNMWEPSVVSLTRHVLGEEAASNLDTGTRSTVEASKNWVNEAREMSLEDLVSKAKELPTPHMQRTPKYDREAHFGTWILQESGCNTRQSILARDLTEVQFADDNCTVLSGTLNPDPYTGKRIEFRHDRIGGDSQAVQIDHIVPLSVAWKTGAASWPQEKRVAFANDPLNLISSDGPANNAKGDKTPDRWMPKNKTFQCEYVTAYTEVTVKYELSVEPKTKAHLVEVLAQC